jgi:hypothetical protein
MSEPEGLARPNHEDAFGVPHVDPPDGFQRGHVTEPNGKLANLMTGFMGINGSRIPRSPDAAPDDLIQGRTLIGYPGTGTRNAWVLECLGDSSDPADRINAACAIVWLGYACWLNAEQDRADQYWATARERLAAANFDPPSELAARLLAALKTFPE